MLLDVWNWILKADSNFSGIKNGPLEEVTNWVTFFIQKALVENEKGSVDIKVCFEAPGFIHSSQSTRSLLTNKCLIEVDKDGWSWQTNWALLLCHIVCSLQDFSVFNSYQQFYWCSTVRDRVECWCEYCCSMLSDN